MRVAKYRDASFNLIHAHDLALLRLFADALGGRTPFPGGGAVLGSRMRVAASGA